MSAEVELNAVKKIEANKYCVNCDAYNKFGHGNICEKFKTFVCSNCKSAHQSFSMRVKSVSMSNWSKEEVDALREENGGGNAVAKRVWLGRWDESQMRKPTDKDHVDYFKKFINRVYNDRAFYDENPAASSSEPPSNSPVTRQESSSGQRRAQAPAPTPSANLLDFSASPAPQPAAPMFDAFSSPQWSGATANPAASTSPGSDGWGAFASAPAPAPVNDGFGDFAAFTAAPPASAPAAPMQSFDPFGSSSSTQAPVFAAPTPAPVQPVSFDPFGSSNTGLLQPAPVSSSQNGFGQFGAISASAPAAPFGSGPAPAKNFSAFDALSGPNLAYGGGYGQQQQPMMGGGMRGGMGTNGGYQQQPQYGIPQQQPQMMMGGAGYGANPAASISTFMDPNAHNRGIGATGYGRPAGQPAGRDPFAGLGLP